MFIYSDEKTTKQLIEAIALDLESHLRAVGKSHLDRGEEVPEWIFEELDCFVRHDESCRR